MIIMRKISTHIVFSSSWTRREQAEKLDEWQITALWDIDEPTNLR